MTRPRRAATWLAGRRPVRPERPARRWVPLILAGALLAAASTGMAVLVAAAAVPVVVYLGRELA